MASAEPNLRECFVDADSLRRKVEGGIVSNIADTQKLLTRSISKYEQCSKFVEELSLFSDNEDLEDISSKDLQYAILNAKGFSHCNRHQTLDISLSPSTLPSSYFAW